MDAITGRWILEKSPSAGAEPSIKLTTWARDTLMNNNRRLPTVKERIVKTFADIGLADSEHPAVKNILKIFEES